MSASLPTVSSPRLECSEVPDHVRAAIERDLGLTVVSATTQPGSFSPGAAARVVLSDGRRAFVRACGSEFNPDTPDRSRAEARRSAYCPKTCRLPGSSRRTTMASGSLVMEDVEGRRPSVPWTDSDVAAVSTSLDHAASARGIEALPAFADLVHALTAWDEVDADRAGVPHRPFVARLLEMLDVQARAREVTRGERLVHWDARNETCCSVPTGRRCCWTNAGGAPPGLPTIRPWQARCAAASLERLEEGTLWA